MSHFSSPDEKTFRFVQKTDSVLNSPVKIGEVFLRKMKTFIHRMDMDNDGCMTWRDFELIGERYARLANLDPDQAKQGFQQLKVAWDSVLKLDEIDGKLNAEQLAGALIRSGRDMVIAVLAFHSSFIFNFLDTEKTGFIVKSQFRPYHQMLNINDEKLSDECFDIMDENKDGKLTFIEFVQAVIDYFLSNDIDSPYNVLYGPLIE